MAWSEWKNVSSPISIPSLYIGTRSDYEWNMVFDTDDYDTLSIASMVLLAYASPTKSVLIIGYINGVPTTIATLAGISGAKTYSNLSYDISVYDQIKLTIDGNDSTYFFNTTITNLLIE